MAHLRKLEIPSSDCATANGRGGVPGSPSLKPESPFALQSRQQRDTQFAVETGRPKALWKQLLDKAAPPRHGAQVTLNQPLTLVMLTLRSPLAHDQRWSLTRPCICHVNRVRSCDDPT